MRETAFCLCCLGLIAWVGLADGQRLQTVPAGRALVPTKIGLLGPDRTVSEWLDYGTRGECDHRLVFDCFEPDTTVPAPSPPTGSDTCGMEDGNNNESGASRWHLGRTYTNMYVSNDMEFDPACAGLPVSRFQVAWYWHVNGAGTGENCAVVVETFEDFDDTCQTGDPNGQGGLLGSVVTLFGYREGDPGEYYYADVDLCGLDQLFLPADGAGSYTIWLLTYVGDDPNWPEDFSLATCAQPMLWGTGTNERPEQDCVKRGLGPCPYPDGPGDSSHQGLIQWDDENPSDGWHQPGEAPDGECYDLTYGVCPDPLGAMACFYVDGECGEQCPGDIDGDDDTDHADLGALLSAWCSQEGDPNWNAAADLDGDGHVGHGDLGAVLGDWGCGT